MGRNNLQEADPFTQTVDQDELLQKAIQESLN